MGKFFLNFCLFFGVFSGLEICLLELHRVKRFFTMIMQVFFNEKSHYLTISAIFCVKKRYKQ